VSGVTPVRVLLVEDNQVFREALELLLGLRNDVEVVGSVGDGGEAVPAAQQHRPDVVLIDYRLPGLDGVEATRALREALPDHYSGWDGLRQAQYLEATSLLPGYILSSQGDRMAMAHAVSFIAANQNRPFFLYMAHTFPHIPLAASPGFPLEARHQRLRLPYSW
jgi:DNA-binding NarL/FixJ family response regulator